jgi:ABC-type multidrug transport system ATPase subunit
VPHDELLERFGLTELAGVYAGRLSLGQRQRLSLAVATYHRPSLLLLDEPFNGLDGATAAMLRELLAEHVRGSGTVLMASHATSNAAAGRLLVLNEGRLLADRDLAPDAVVADVDSGSGDVADVADAAAAGSSQRAGSSQ